METIKAQVEFAEFDTEMAAGPAGDVVTELNDLELALVGGGTGDVLF